MKNSRNLSHHQDLKSIGDPLSLDHDSLLYAPSWLSTNHQIPYSLDACMMNSNKFAKAFKCGVGSGDCSDVEELGLNGLLE